VNTGAIAIGLAKEMGVRPSYLRSDEEVAAIEAKQEEQQIAMLQAEQLQQGSQAVLNLSKANQLSEAA
jgi:hypothetical protein